MASSWQMRLTALWPALAALLVATLLLATLLPGLLGEMAARQLLDTVQVLAPVMAERIRTPGEPPGELEGEELQAAVQGLAAGGPLRLTLLAPDGRVLADSAQSWEGVRAMDNHAGRPEVRAALGSPSGEGTAVRRSATTHLSYAYATVTFRGAGGRPYLLRLAEPLAQVDRLRGRLVGSMALAAAVALLVLAGVLLYLDWRLFRPLAGIIHDAGRLASGEFGRRLEVPEQDDLARLARALNRLGGRVEEQLAVVEEERDQLRRILASMSDGVLVTDCDGRAVLANAAFARLFRLGGGVAGKLPLEISRQPQLGELVMETLGGGLEREGPGERKVETPDGRVVSLAGTRFDGDGGAVVVARDVTETERLGAMRRDFVANVSHELKTPLSAIRGLAETLRDGALDDRATAERFVDRVLVQCQRLQALLEDLLTLSRLESVEIASDPEAVDLSQLARDARRLVAAQAEEKGVEMVVEARPTAAVRGSHQDLERLLVNLLENAVRYNRPGGRVVLRLYGDAAGAVLEVEDTGIGIPSEALPRLFERFYRVDKGRSRAEGGTGLGLSIVKHVVQSHGGEVEVESALGEGSTFRVRLPYGAVT